MLFYFYFILFYVFTQERMSFKFLIQMTLRGHLVITKAGCIVPHGRKWRCLDHHIKCVCILQLCHVSQLSQPAVLNNYIRPAPLPDDSMPQLDAGTTCTVSGWGVTRIYSFYLSPVLRAVDVDYIPNCYYYYYYRVNENMICAGSRFGGKDSCQVRQTLV